MNFSLGDLADRAPARLGTVRNGPNNRVPRGICRIIRDIFIVRPGKLSGLSLRIRAFLANDGLRLGMFLWRGANTSGSALHFPNHVWRLAKRLAL